MPFSSLRALAAAPLLCGLAVTALAASSAWWPSDQADAAPQVEVTTRSGVVLCGDLVSPGSAAVGIATSSRAFQVDNDSLLRVRPVDGCG